MAALFDLAASAASVAGVGSLTYNSANTVAGATLMIIDVIIGQADTGVIAGITVGGQVATFKGGLSYSSSRHEKWFLVNPPSGVQSIVITVTGSVASTSVTTSGAKSYTGSDTSTPLGSFFSNSGTGTASTVTVTDSATNDLVDDSIATGSGGEAVSGSNTQRWKLDTNTNTSGNNGAGSTTPGATGNVIPTWTFTSDSWGAVAVNIKAAAASSSNVGSITQSFHPGRGTTQARFFQPPRGTAISPLIFPDTGSTSTNQHPGRRPGLGLFFVSKGDYTSAPNPIQRIIMAPIIPE